MPRKTTSDNRIGGHPPESQLWVVDDVAGFLRCSRDAVYRMVERREIPHIRLFNRKGLRFRAEEIEDWLASQQDPHRKDG